MFEESGKWFFFTREKTIEGPYHSRSDADNGLEFYISNALAGLQPSTPQFTQAS